MFSKQDFPKQFLEKIYSLRDFFLSNGWTIDWSFNKDFDEGWKVPYQIQLKFKEDFFMVVRIKFNQDNIKVVLTIDKNNDHQTIIFTCKNFEDIKNKIFELKKLIEKNSVKDAIYIILEKKFLLTSNKFYFWDHISIWLGFVKWLLERCKNLAIECCERNLNQYFETKQSWILRQTIDIINSYPMNERLDFPNVKNYEN